MGVDELMARARAVYDAARKASDDRHQPPSHHVTALSVFPVLKVNDKMVETMLHDPPGTEHVYMCAMMICFAFLSC